MCGGKNKRTLMHVPKIYCLHILQSEMVQIISIENPEGDCDKVKPVFYGDRLTEVIETRKDVDEYVVVSIFGPKRNGKSFLTNFMICHLRELQKVIAC